MIPIPKTPNINLTRHIPCCRCRTSMNLLKSKEKTKQNAVTGTLCRCRCGRSLWAAIWTIFTLKCSWNVEKVRNQTYFAINIISRLYFACSRSVNVWLLMHSFIGKKERTNARTNEQINKRMTAWSEFHEMKFTNEDQWHKLTLSKDADV